MKYYLGIDPGLTGALAFYNPLTGDLKVFDMPVNRVTVSGKNKNSVDLYSLAKIIDEYAADTIKAIIEEVGTMPGQGITSAFNFGFSTGVVNMAVAAFFISMTSVRPIRWKREMHLTNDKAESRREASRLLPQHSGMWNLVKHDGRAEAALLAYYLWKKETSNVQ